MNILDTTEWQGPIPAAEGDYAIFFSACSRGQLMIQECLSCKHRQAYPRSACAFCAGPVEWIVCSDLGRIHTFTVVRQYRVDPFTTDLPYVVAIIDLDEGPRMMGTVIECDPEQIRIGQQVEAVAKSLSPDIAVPVWRVTSS